MYLSVNLQRCQSSLFLDLLNTHSLSPHPVQARSNNICDVAAKDASQETLVNLVALACSLAILPMIREDDQVSKETSNKERFGAPANAQF